MLTIGFSGWFQCRLATDPDPYDEPRGVSGYVHAYAGEPDLDRIVHLQKPAFVRRLSPDIGVRVNAAAVDGVPIPGAALLGAEVELLGSPKFEGRNGVVAEDGFEPLFPFDLQIRKDGMRLRRAVVPADTDYPFEGLNANGVDARRGAALQRLTGIADLAVVWQYRARQLAAASGDLPDPERTATVERLNFLRDNLARPNGTQRFFSVAMTYSYDLTSEAPVIDGIADATGMEPETRDAWRAEFALGAWDADTLCGFCDGVLSIPRKATPLPARSATGRMPGTGLRRRDVVG